MRQKVSRIKLLVMLFLLTSMLMVFTFASAEPADETTLRNVLTRLSSLISPENDTPFPELNHITRKTKNYTVDATFKLPASLKTIQDEAFEGTSLVSVDLSGTSVEQIGERAFANISTLIGVKFPEKTRFIAKTVFDGSSHVTLTGKPGGYTRTWARENGIPFVPITTFTADAQTVCTAAIDLRRSDTPQASLPANQKKTNGNNPIKRISGEIINTRYQEGVAYHLQGRAPPIHAESITNRI